MPDGFASTPEPPYYAVIFTSQRTEADDGYEATAQAMYELALKQPGCFGAESSRGQDGLGITVSYFIVGNRFSWPEVASAAYAL